MVVKPFDFVMKGKQGLVQPAVFRILRFYFIIFHIILKIRLFKYPCVDWSGRRGSNPRRPAWEIDSKLIIIYLASIVLIADRPRLLILLGLFGGVC